MFLALVFGLSWLDIKLTIMLTYIQLLIVNFFQV